MRTTPSPKPALGSLVTSPSTMLDDPTNRFALEPPTLYSFPRCRSTQQLYPAESHLSLLPDLS